ncbi:MAG: fasciclin domain-containing protein [Deltaproteobacteria bacterium]|nr:fasciclin domain-containing protein [Deltaproteobacteria bacterium]
MNRRIYGLCEAAILVLLGVAILWFALSAHYGLLMNVKFRWLTVIGAALLLVMGLFALSAVQKRPGLNTLIFALMLLVTFVGKPYLPDANSMSLLEPPLQAGLWDQVDQTRFPRKELQDLYTKEAEEMVRNNASFTTIGIVKRLEVLDKQDSFALMTSMMFCCIADALAVGFRVPTDELENFEEGQWIMVSGKLVPEETEITLPNFRFGRATMSSVHKTYHVQPEKIMSYNRIDQLPLLTDQLSGQTNRLFSEALQASGLWQDLEEEGPFTLFVPVDQALEALGDVSFEELSSDALKQLVSSHIVRGKFFSRDLMDRETVETLSGRVLQVELSNGKLRINQSRLLLKDTEARNGVIHYIYPAIVLDDFVSVR